MRKLFISIFFAISVICGALCLSACFSCGYKDFVTFSDDVLVYEGYVEEGREGENEYGELTVTGYVGNPIDITIPEITDRGFKVTAISGNAFDNCNSLKSISIPASVSFISNGVFGGCKNLISINIAGDNPVYRSEGECIIETQTNTVIAACNASSIPDGALVIGSSAFLNCNLIKEIVIPESVMEINDGAFTGCGALERFTVDENNNIYSSLDGILYNKKKTDILSVPVAIRGEITFPDSLTEIKEETFIGCTKLSGALIPKTVERIREGAFSGCSGLERITLPFVGEEKSTDIYVTDADLLGYIFGTKYFEGGVFTRQATGRAETYDFYLPASLKSVTVTGGKIMEYAFSNCSYIESIKIENGVEEVQNFAFSGCKFISVNLDVDTLREDAFSECEIDAVFLSATAFAKIGDKVRLQLKSITITHGEELAGDAFHHCQNTEYISLPSTLKKFGNGVFSGLTYYEFNVYSGGYYADNGRGFHSVCSVLKGITVAEGNTKYYSENNCLIERETKTLILGCQGSIIPDGVEIIGEYAFSGCSGLKSLTVPESVVTIEKYAFSGCTGLTNLTIPDGVTGIGDSAFKYCNNLISLKISDSVRFIGSGAFEVCNSIEEIVVSEGNANYYSQGNCLIEFASKKLIFGCRNSIIPDGVLMIGEYAFEYCRGLTKIIIPEGVTTIGRGSFSGCSGLTDITIPAGLNFIDSYVFNGCGELTNITVEEGNENYYSQGNCLIATDSQTLIRGGKNSVIPDGVLVIGEYAFENCVGLTEVTIPTGITEICENAFRSCENLKTVTIPVSVKKIGMSAFILSGITQIIYEGSQEEWNAISKDKYWDNIMKDYTVHCTDGEIVKE